MTTPLRSPRNRCALRAGTASAVLLALFWALTLAASPDLHERVHPDAHDEGHDCGAMLFLSGAAGPASFAVIFSLDPPRLPLVRMVALPRSVAGVLRPSDRAVLEHGPPGPSRPSQVL